MAVENPLASLQPERRVPPGDWGHRGRTRGKDVSEGSRTSLRPELAAPAPLRPLHRWVPCFRKPPWPRVASRGPERGRAFPRSWGRASLCKEQDAGPKGFRHLPPPPWGGAAFLCAASGRKDAQRRVSPGTCLLPPEQGAGDLRKAQHHPLQRRGRLRPPSAIGLRRVSLRGAETRPLHLAILPQASSLQPRPPADSCPTATPLDTQGLFACPAHHSRLFIFRFKIAVC